jgi:hypothetical protein
VATTHYDRITGGGRRHVDAVSAACEAWPREGVEEIAQRVLRTIGPEELVEYAEAGARLLVEARLRGRAAE